MQNHHVKFRTTKNSLITMRPVGLGLEVGTARTTLSDSHPAAATTHSERSHLDTGYTEDVPPLSPRRSPEPRPGSSCYALRAAVGLLAFWDDFDAEKIGEGFYAEVFKIRHKSDGRVMVVKVGKQKVWRTNQHKMIQELELLNKLQHPNVVRYMGACVKEGHIHPVLEYVSGGALSDILADSNLALSWRQKGEIATDIAHGMTYLHSQNVCHRDLTSGNCLIRRKPHNVLQAVLTDFGLARVLGCMPGTPPNTPRTPEDVQTLEEPDFLSLPKTPSVCMDVPRKMSVVGTAYWMAPEMMRGEEYTRQVDVFSFGIVVCEIVARITACPDDLPRTGTFGLDLKLFKEKCPGIPAPFLEIAEDCCSMDPRDRPVFLELYRRLDTLHNSLDTEETTPVSYDVNLTDIIRTNENDDENGGADSSDTFRQKPDRSWAIDPGGEGNESHHETIYDAVISSVCTVSQFLGFIFGCIIYINLSFVLWVHCDVNVALFGNSLICACVGWLFENSASCVEMARTSHRLISVLWHRVLYISHRVQYRRQDGSDFNENIPYVNHNGDAHKDSGQKLTSDGRVNGSAMAIGEQMSILKNVREAPGQAIGSVGDEDRKQNGARNEGSRTSSEKLVNPCVSKLLVNGSLPRKRVSFSLQGCIDND